MPVNRGVKEADRVSRGLKTETSRNPMEKPAGSSRDMLDNILDWRQKYADAGKTWKTQIAALRAVKARGVDQLEAILQAIDQGDFATAMNLSKRFYSTVKDGMNAVKDVIKNPQGVAVNIAESVLSVLLETDPDKRSDAAKTVLKGWFPSIDWDAPPAVWRKEDGTFVDRSSANTDYAGRPLTGFSDPYMRKQAGFRGPGAW